MKMKLETEQGQHLIEKNSEASLGIEAEEWTKPRSEKGIYRCREKTLVCGK